MNVNSLKSTFEGRWYLMSIKDPKLTLLYYYFRLN